MSSRDQELEAHRMVTKQFIAANPTVLILIPRVRVKTGSGAVWNWGPPRDPQVVRLIDQSSSAGPQPGTITTADGQQRLVQYQLMAEWTAEVGLWDTWVDSDGIRWEIAELIPNNGYERRAQVVRYGES